MKKNNNYRQTLLLILLLCLCLMLAGCGAENPAPEEMPEEQIPTIINEPAPAALRDTVVFYPDSNGFIVPIMKQIEWSDDIHKQALNELKADAVAKIDVLGLLPVLSENAKIGLYIKDGIAVVDLEKKELKTSDPVDEANKIISIVNTLCGFDNVEKVLFTVNGEKNVRLSNGTDLKRTFSAFDVNPQAADKKLDVKKASKATLYFPSASGDFIIPVTKYYKGSADIETAVNDLIKSPAIRGLSGAFPENLELKNYSIDDSKLLTLNFSKEFNELINASDLGENALSTLYLTCLGFDNIQDVVILVDNKDFDGVIATMAKPLYPNEY